MNITNSIEIVSPTNGKFVSEWITVQVKVTDDALRHNLQLFVRAADGKFHPQRVPDFNEETKLFDCLVHVGTRKAKTNPYLLMAISTKRVWNVDEILDDDTFSSAPVIVYRIRPFQT